MIGRQKLVLSFINHAGGQVSRLQLVKWAFLFAAESRSEAAAKFYQFLPYRFGPFSFTLYHEIDTLLRDGHLAAPSEHDLQISKNAQASAIVLDKNVEAEIDRFWSRYGGYSTQQLLETVYARYPWFTLNSDNKERRAASLPKAEFAVYTAGYEGLQVDGFLNLLLESGIRQVIDVREHPISRRYGFHKKTFSSLCQRLGITYKHFPQLGVPSAWRTSLGSASAYARLFARYEEQILAGQAASIKQAAASMTQLPSVLVCQEAEPTCCHRSRLAGRVSNITGLPIVDLRAAP